MKNPKLLQLFFWFLTLNILSVFKNEIYSQTKQDSISMYYQSLIEIKDVDQTTKAFSFFNKAYEDALNQNDTLQATKYLELIAFGEFKIGFIYDSELSTVKTFTLLEAFSDKSKTIEPRKRLTNQLGMIYRKIEDFENARRFYNKALELNDNLAHKIAIVNNIANTYADSENYKEAVDILMPYYDKVLDLENTSIKAIFLDGLGYYQSKIGYPEALKNMQLGLDIKLKLQDLVALFSSYRHLCLFYFDNNETLKAKLYSKKVSDISAKINTPIFKLEALELQLRLEENPDFSGYISLSKEIERTKHLRENKYAAIKYNYKEKEKQAQQLELQVKDGQILAEQEKLNKTIYQSIALIGLLTTIFLYIIIKIKHRKDKLQQVYNTETRISKKVHDEVANGIYHVITKIQSAKTSNNDVLDDLEQVYNKTRDISKENSFIELEETFEEQLRGLLLSYESDTVNIITKDITKVNWGSLDHAKKIVLYRILQELMTNMRKHSQASIVVLTFSQTGKKISINYRDNGVGCNLVKSDGLHNTENRIEAINGTITFETQLNHGFSVKLIV